MDERWANIDLVFRNGLKDFEALPPPEVWESIKPAIKVKPQPFKFMRAAAMIAVLLTISFLAYRWSREISKVSDDTLLAFEIDTFSPVIIPAFSTPLVRTPSIVDGKEKDIVTPLQESFISGITENLIQQNNLNSFLSEGLTTSKISNLSFGSSYPAKSQVLSNMTASDNITIDLKPVIPEYIPESSTIQGKERWSIGAMASPTYYSSFNSDNNDISRQMAASEQSVVSYSGGVALSYKLNKRLSIQTGLYYSSLGQEIDGINSYGGFQKYDYTKGDYNFAVQTSSGTVYIDNADVFVLSTIPGERILTAYTNDVFDPDKANLEYISNTLIQNFSFLELPVLLRYKVVDKTFDINLIGGISYNMMVNNSVYTMVDGGKFPVGKTEGLDMINLSSSLGMGLEYNFSKKLSLNLEPTFRYYLNTFNEPAGTTIHPYSFGVFSGISYRF
jgi:hypothetical protein